MVVNGKLQGNADYGGTILHLEFNHLEMKSGIISQSISIMNPPQKVRDAAANEVFKTQIIFG